MRRIRTLGAVMAATLVPGTLALAGEGANAPPAEVQASEAGSRGALVTPGHVRPRGPQAGRRACSLRASICVHGAVADRDLLAVLSSVERAWDVETGALGLPPPDPDLETGAYDVYLVPALAEGTLTLAGTRDPRSPLDRASAFSLVDAAVAADDRCARDTALASSVAWASLLRASPATGEATARAQAAYFARLAVPCAMAEVDGIAEYQRTPERSLFDRYAREGARARAEFSEGASLFYWWLDTSFGRGPGDLVRALWAMAGTRTPLGATSWRDEPDVMDVLRESFKDVIASGKRWEDALAEYGVTRALLGPRDDGANLPEARPLGDALAPRIDWTIDWPSKPRRLASPAPLAPTGSAYLLVRRAGAAAGARLRLEADWEQHAAIRWTVVKLDAKGREMGRIAIAAPPRATEAQATIAGLDAVDALLVVATNVGDPYVPLDPDDERFEPHGWLVTLAAE